MSKSTVQYLYLAIYLYLSMPDENCTCRSSIRWSNIVDPFPGKPNSAGTSSASVLSRITVEAHAYPKNAMVHGSTDFT